jgi:WD40 repeat protein
MHDAYRMLLAYRIPILSHALQVYCSPAATMPECALLESAQCTSLAINAPLLSSGAINWSSEIQQSVKGIPRLLSGRPNGWSRNVAIIEGHSNMVSSVAFSPDGKRIVSGSWDKSIRIWDADTGSKILELRGHSNWIRSVASSPDGKRIASPKHAVV